jgi:hypothetical protein
MWFGLEHTRTHRGDFLVRNPPTYVPRTLGEQHFAQLEISADAVPRRFISYRSPGASAACPRPIRKDGSLQVVR